MSAQVEDRHREAAMTALNSATREQHGEWHPEVAAVAQLLADTEAAAREQGAAVYSDSVDAERAGWVARVAELERERDEARGRAVGWRNAMRSLRNVVGEIAAVVQKGNHESTADAVRRALEAVDGAEESPAPEAQAGTTVAQEREEPVAAPRPVGADGIGVGKDSAITKLVDELIAERDALRSEVERLRPWARFGARAFEDFWQDGDPGDLEGGDLQEMARDCGLLGRTAEVDAGATHADGCDWQPGMHVDDCDCWSPMLAPYTQEDSNAT